MFFKFLFFLIIIYVLYLLFFKKKSVNNNHDSSDVDTLIECVACKTFVSANEAIKKNGEYFCSPACAKRKK